MQCFDSGSHAVFLGVTRSIWNKPCVGLSSQFLRQDIPPLRLPPLPLSVCVPACLPALYVQCPQRPEKSIRSPGARVTCRWGCWELNLSLLLRSLSSPMSSILTFQKLLSWLLIFGLSVPVKTQLQFYLNPGDYFFLQINAVL